MTTARRRADRERLRIAEEATDELREALRGAGVTLPSLRVDLVSYASETAEPPLVELGRCTPEVARRLAAVLVRGGREGGR
ncbi:MAG TPA: hypothetical protein VE546_05260 [Streptomyces sp.]|uniref:hypothetical protein n=1 Tax=Streptomyces sp. TaxID=1931 RepID=UPI002D68F0E8|nr:hypothetical protein [Streptomyces sp.]HZG02970.1 hypothetical protein [Streptomyces sp.]